MCVGYDDSSDTILNLSIQELDCAHFLGVEALREMRAVPRSLYDTEIFRRHIVVSVSLIALPVTELQ